MLKSWVRRATGLFLGLSIAFAGVTAEANPPPYPLPLLNGPTSKAVTRVTQMTLFMLSDMMDLTRYALDPERVNDSYLRGDWAKAGFDRRSALLKARTVEEWAYRLSKSANLVRVAWQEEGNGPRFQQAWWVYTRDLTTAYGIFTDYQRFLDFLWAPQGPLYSAADAKGRAHLINILNHLETTKHQAAAATCILQRGPELSGPIVALGAPAIFPVWNGQGFIRGPFCLYDYMRAYNLNIFYRYGTGEVLPPIPLPYYPYDVTQAGTPYFDQMKTPWFPQAQMQAFVMQNVSRDQWGPLIDKQILGAPSQEELRFYQEQVARGGERRVEDRRVIEDRGRVIRDGLPTSGGSATDFFGQGGTGPVDQRREGGDVIELPRNRTAPVLPRLEAPKVDSDVLGTPPSLDESQWEIAPDKK